MRKRNNRSKQRGLTGSEEPVIQGLLIESVDLDGQGVTHLPDGKVVFIDGALPFEKVSVRVTKRKATYENADLVAVERSSPSRATPLCPHFGLHEGACGGCKIQHLHPQAQVSVKQRALEDALWHVGQVKAELILRPISGPEWGYRHRARLSARYVTKKEQVLVGFHERKSRYVADMQTCQVLPPHVSDLLMPLRALFASMDARQTLPQIELACSTDVTALVLRHMEPLSDADIARLRAFALEHTGVQWWLQSKGPETVCLLDPDSPLLAYNLSNFDIQMPFKPTDFTQVNPFINDALVTRAINLLGVQNSERVIDWFCGLGNFTLPLATVAREVLGVEGSDALVERATNNWAANNARKPDSQKLAPTHFVARNLFEMTPEILRADGYADKWMVDPPREGAFALVKALAEQLQLMANLDEQALASSWQAPSKIVYVSCNPATLARDAQVLVQECGYKCSAAGVVNMFPHTAHVESIAVFEKITADSSLN